MRFSTLLANGNNLIAASNPDLADGLVISGIGILITFIVLAIMIGILYLFQLIFKTRKQADIAVVAEDLKTDAELVAVVTAAIAQYRGDEEGEFTVKDIKKL